MVFTADTTLVSYAASSPYTVAVVAKCGTTSSAAVAFTYTVIDPCETATLTAPAVATTTYTYPIGDPAMTITIGAFTASESGCAFTYSLVEASDSTTTPDSIFSLPSTSSPSF